MALQQGLLSVRCPRPWHALPIWLHIMALGTYHSQAKQLPCLLCVLPMGVELCVLEECVQVPL